MLFSNNYRKGATPASDDVAVVSGLLSSLQTVVPADGQQVTQKRGVPLYGTTRTQELIQLHQTLQQQLANSGIAVLAGFSTHLANEFDRLIDTDIVSLTTYLSKISAKLDFFLFIRNALVFNQTNANATEVDQQEFDSLFGHYTQPEDGVEGSTAHHTPYDRPSVMSLSNFPQDEATAKIDEIYQTQLRRNFGDDIAPNAEFSRYALNDYAQLIVDFAKPQLNVNLQRIIAAIHARDIDSLINELAALTTSLQQLFSTNNIQFKTKQEQDEFINKHLGKLLENFFGEFDARELSRLHTATQSKVFERLHLVLAGNLQGLEAFLTANRGNQLAQYNQRDQTYVAIGSILTIASRLNSLYQAIHLAITNNDQEKPLEVAARDIQRKYHTPEHRAAKDSVENAGYRLAIQEESTASYIAELNKRFALQVIIRSNYTVDGVTENLEDLLETQMRNSSTVSKLNAKVELSDGQNEEDRLALATAIEEQVSLNEKLLKVLTLVDKTRLPKQAQKYLAQLSAYSLRYNGLGSAFTHLLRSTPSIAGYCESLSKISKKQVTLASEVLAVSKWAYPRSIDSIAIYTPSTFYQFVKSFMDSCITSLNSQEANRSTRHDHYLSINDKAAIFRHFLRHADAKQFMDAHGSSIHPFNAILDFINSDLFAVSQANFGVVNRLHLHLLPEEARVMHELAVEVKQFFNANFEPSALLNTRAPSAEKVKKVQFLHSQKIQAKNQKLNEQGRFSRFGTFSFVPAGLRVMDKELQTLPDVFTLPPEDAMEVDSFSASSGDDTVLDPYAADNVHPADMTVDGSYDDDSRPSESGAGAAEEKQQEACQAGDDADADMDAVTVAGSFDGQASVDGDANMTDAEVPASILTRHSLHSLPDHTQQQRSPGKSAKTQSELDSALEQCDAIFATLDREIYTVKTAPYTGNGFRTELMQRTYNAWSKAAEEHREVAGGNDYEFPGSVMTPQDSMFGGKEGMAV